mgnify:FL=1
MAEGRFQIQRNRPPCCPRIDKTPRLWYNVSVSEAIDLTAKQTAFLIALREYGTIRRAAEIAHVGRSTVQRWREENINGFRAQFLEAEDHFVDGIVDHVYTEMKEWRIGHNPTMPIFMLKALRPNTYRELTQVQDDHARELLKKLEALTGLKVPDAVEDRPDSQLTALEQVQRILNAGDV